MDITTYIKSINEQFRTGIAREHSYRPMLQQLLNEMLDGLVVTNEPARIDCGAPDFIISSKKTNTPVFYILKLADNVFPYILYIFIVRTRMSAR